MKIKTIKRLFLILIVLAVGVGGLYLGYNLFFSKEAKINRILKTSEYSYLPYEAKNYIKNTYMKTGDILLTEKNKEKNKPYLNPKYIEYLLTDKENLERDELIPSSIVVDYEYKKVENNNIPSHFDLRNVNGNNYVSGQKDQGNLGLCWSFASMAHAESHLLMQGITKNFSERQNDYATSVNGISGYNPFNMGRYLGSGGNFRNIEFPGINGISFVDSTIFPYNNNNYSQKPIADVINYSNSQYEINATIDMPTLNLRTMDLSVPENIELKDSYLNTIKENIMTYGGGYVGTQAPDYYCSSALNGTQIVRDDNRCVNNSGHAMEIIGWDDDIEYSYCVVSETEHIADTSSCAPENIESGRGAWILKNSWGNDLSFVYLAYDSDDSDISFITNMTPTSERTWDNSYFNTAFIDEAYTTYYGSNDVSLYISPEKPEKLEKIKFTAAETNATYSIYSGNSNTPIKMVQTELPGVYTVDISDLNITFSKQSSQTISIKGASMAYPLVLFTSNVDQEQSASTDDDIEYITSSSEEYKMFRIYTETWNIDSGEEIDYKLYKNDEEINISYMNNKVGNNIVYATIVVPGDIEDGEYRLDTLYNDVVLDTVTLNLEFPEVNLEGSGTEDDPYLIETGDQMEQINIAPSAYYELCNHIEVSPEDGYILSSFSGVLEGNNYSITTNGAAFADSITANTDHNTIIKNVHFKHVKYQGGVSATSASDLGVSGGIANLVTDCANAGCDNTTKVIFENVSIKSDGISNEIVGGLFGAVVAGKENGVEINNAYSEAYMYGNYIGGLVGTISSADGTNGSAKIRNVEINDDTMIEQFINDDIIYGGVIGALGGNIDLQYFIVKPCYRGTYNANLIGVVENDITQSNIQYGYYVNNEIGEIFYDEYTGETNKSLNISSVDYVAPQNLSDNNLYTLWGNNFTSNWEIKTIYDVKRFPLLKFMGGNFTYTPKIEDINMLPNDEQLVDSMGFEILSIGNRNIVDINESSYLFTKVDSGTTTLEILNYYDGYYDTIHANVSSDNYDYKIRYHYNAPGNNTTVDQPISKYTKRMNQNVFTRPGYSFFRWYYDANSTEYAAEDGEFMYGKYETMLEHAVEGIVDIYANWSANTYYIDFEANGAPTCNNCSPSTGKMQSITATYDQDVILTSNQYEWNSFENGYRSFTKWNLEEDGSGNAYEDEEKVSNLCDTKFCHAVLYAQWQKEEFYYKVYYVGTDIVEEFSCKEGYECYLRTETTSIPGYHISTYNTNENGDGTQYSPKDDISGISPNGEGKILYAFLEPKTYQVTFNPNGGIVETISKNVTYGSAYGELPEAIRSHYTFLGWNTKEDGSGDIITSESIYTDTASKGLYAMWHENEKYTITFYANNGTEAKTTQLAYENESTQLDLNTFSKSGYGFASWNTKQDGSGTEYLDGANISPNADISLYAQWSANSYRIRFLNYDGDVLQSNLVSTGEVPVYNGENPSRPSTPEFDYQFTGWNKKIEPASGDTDYTATYIETKRKYIIVFANYDKTELASVVLEYGETPEYTGKTPTRPDTESSTYTFIGWEPEIQPVTQSTSYMAKYSEETRTYLIKFVNYDGTILQSNDWKYSDIPVYKGETPTKPSTDSNDYIFIGWDSEIVSVTGEKVYTAKFMEVAKEYTITFHANNGTDETATQNVKGGTNQKLNKNNFTNGNLTFKEWNTSSIGTGTSYGDGANINIKSDIDLYAIWVEEIDYVINNYIVDNGFKLIEKIPEKTPVNTFTSYFQLGYGYGIEVDTVDLDGKEVIYTGGKTTITKGLEIYTTFTNIVFGDPEGDGEINSGDLYAIRLHLLNSKPLSGVYFIAADIDESDEINSYDLFRVRQHLIGTKNINE